jgi:hypothetical protein
MNKNMDENPLRRVEGWYVMGEKDAGIRCVPASRKLSWKGKFEKYRSGVDCTKRPCVKFTWLLLQKNSFVRKNLWDIWRSIIGPTQEHRWPLAHSSHFHFQQIYLHHSNEYFLGRATNRRQIIDDGNKKGWKGKGTTYKCQQMKNTSYLHRKWCSCKSNKICC